MNALNSIGWTLLHSLWQGLLIFIVLKIAVRATSQSNVRYAMGVGSVLLMTACSVTTFFVLHENSSGSQGFSFVATITAGQVAEQSSSMMAWIDHNIIWLVRFWMLGFAIGIIRIAAGLFYINRLRKHSLPVAGEWMHMVNGLSENLNIRRVVAMAEAGITSPMVVGFMKPMILFPFGLLSGLTAEQVETILVHELSHIRRQDYIINLFQAVVETIFFFNPFVILISSLIRDERENCCDDMVIARGISPISYVRTLAQLEASRSSSALALGISGSKNQLLNRIKRIMENSAKNDWGKGRLVPVALVFLGLICASWLSIGSEAETNVSESTKHNVLAADTSREDGLKVIRSKKGRIHYEDPTDPVEDIPEIEFVPDESFDAPSPSDLDVVIPEMAEIPWQDLTGAMKALDAVPPMKIDGFTFPKIPTDAFNFDEMWQGDSIPGFKYYGEAEEWEQFEKEFTKKFKEQFKEFYGKNQEEFDKMMEEMKKERREAAEVVDLDQLRRGTYIMDADKLNLLRDQLTQLDNQVNHLYVNPGPQGFQSPQIYVPDHEGLARMDDALEQLEALKEMQFDEQFRRRTDEELSLMNERLREQGHFLEEVARNAESYKKELTNLLRQDGYIDSNESIGGVNISIDDDNGNMTINGKPIKQKDQVKYRALHDKYFAPTYKREGRRSE